MRAPHDLLREWSSEQRHDAVAHDPVHHALIMVDGFEHVVENGVEEAFCASWVAIAMILRDPTIQQTAR